MRCRITVAVGLCCALLAGCMETTGGTEVSAPAPEVGSDYVSLANAAALFSEVCVEGYPNYATPPAFLSSDAFRQNPDTRTYYHQTLNLSFNLQKRGYDAACSMVFASREDATQLAIGLSAVTSQLVDGTADVHIDPDNGRAHVPVSPRSEMRFESNDARTGLHLARITIGS